MAGLSLSPDEPSQPRAARLADRYPGALRRAGSVFPVLVESMRGPGAIDDVLAVGGGDVVCDPEPLRLGASHLQGLRASRPGLHDGRILRWLETSGGVVRAAPGSYFDMLATCDALRAEFEGTGGDLPLRRLAHRIAGDPLRSGAGRAAGIGVSVLLTLPGQPRRLVVGRRGSGVATDAGRWHVAPSGMLEPDGVSGTVTRELREELGVELDRREVTGRLRLLGICHDLLRLRPDIVVRLDLEPGEIPDLARSEAEFAELADVEVSPTGLAAFWEEHSPATVTPPAAGAIALLELSL
jgi:8-oxo-dGTP pyrophosphatase MutT (NUDIX family)